MIVEILMVSLLVANVVLVWGLTRLLASRRELKPQLEALAQRMDQTTVTATTAAMLLKINAEDSRASMSRLGAVLDRLEDRAIGVAKDLADSHSRADSADGPTGAAADAAAKLT